MNQNNSNIKSEVSQVRFVEVGEENVGQRLDNFLITLLKGVPRTHVYKLIRTDEVRINKKRVKADQRLVQGDVIRIAPVRVATRAQAAGVSEQVVNRLQQAILYEDDALLVLNKPAGWAVHGGSGISLGVIEALRQSRPYAQKWELVHRLDRDTSGCLVVAKKASALKSMQANWENFSKSYVALVSGQWSVKDKFVDVPLLKNVLQSGERVVKVSSEGKSALSEFSVLQQWSDVSLVGVKLHTGRTHQIRVHAQWKKHSILGDERYADDLCLSLSKQLSVKRLMLHARVLRFQHPLTQEEVEVSADLPEDMNIVLRHLDRRSSNH